jgi:hypothetical protein
MTLLLPIKISHMNLTQLFLIEFFKPIHLRFRSCKGDNE